MYAPGPMATLEQAQARFARALDRVEAALGRGAALRAERERLAADLARLSKDHETLKTAARAVSGRLAAAAAQARALSGE